ncbi:MAG: phage tail protein [Lachnospiraceae bacterium]|nr:phage tail protein [Lachnospiraceae bacterium]
MDIHRQLVSNYRFKVLIDNHVMSFAKVSGLYMDLETEMLSEGGHNGSGYIAAVPTKGVKTLRLQSGVLNNANSIMDKMSPGIYLRQGLVVMMLDMHGNTEIKYVAERALVTKWEISEMDAQNGQVLIHTFEIAYTQMKIMR